METQVRDIKALVDVSGHSYQHEVYSQFDLIPRTQNTKKQKKEKLNIGGGLKLEMEQLLQKSDDVGAYI